MYADVKIGEAKRCGVPHTDGTGVLHGGGHSRVRAMIFSGIPSSRLPTFGPRCSYTSRAQFSEVGSYVRCLVASSSSRDLT